MQFMGKVDLALQGGSEEIYVPDSNGWAPHAKVAVFDKFYADARQPWISHSNPSMAAAEVIFGRAYNNTNYGMVLYVASHTFHADGEAQNTAVARLWGNLILRTGLDRLCERASLRRRRPRERHDRADDRDREGRPRATARNVLHPSPIIAAPDYRIVPGT